MLIGKVCIEVHKNALWIFGLRRGGIVEKAIKTWYLFGRELNVNSLRNVKFFSWDGFIDNSSNVSRSIACEQRV